MKKLGLSRVSLRSCRFRVVALSAPVVSFALTILISGAVGLAAPPKLEVKSTKGNVAAIAMDGPLAAYDVKSALQGPRCNRLFVWNVQTGSGAIVSGPGTCEADDSSTGAGVSEIAVAGRRLAWLVNVGGNTESIDELYTASLPEPKEVRIAEAERTGDVDCALEGPAIGGLVGDADLLAVNLWTEAVGDSESCTTEVTRATLRTISGTTTARIAAGTNAWLAQSADMGRIAVRRSDDRVAISSKSGRLQRVFTPSSVKEVVLRKDYLVVLTTTKTLEIFDARSGSLLYTRPVKDRAAHLLDVHSGVAVYAVGGRVHGIELLSGRSAIIAAAPREVVGLELEAPGAVYAFNSPWTQAKGEVGNVVFLPLERVRAALARR